jgi:hypothetical protein
MTDSRVSRYCSAMAAIVTSNSQRLSEVNAAVKRWGVAV